MLSFVKKTLKPAAALGKLGEPHRCDTGDGFESGDGRGCGCPANMTAPQTPVAKQSYMEKSLH